MRIYVYIIGRLCFALLCFALLCAALLCCYNSESESEGTRLLHCVFLGGFGWMDGWMDVYISIVTGRKEGKREGHGSLGRSFGPASKQTPPSFPVYSAYYILV